jgi:glycosidase
MQMRARRWAILAWAVSSLAGLAQAQDFKREVIYQIITDRFFDGDATNNNPIQSAGLYDAAKSNWRMYWGGDLAGIQQKLSYLQGLGVTTLWISPPVDNLNLSIPFGGQATAPYHGYQARDFKRIEEHFGDASNSWTAFDNLVTAAHGLGIKVVVDFAPNHSNQNNDGEYGALYDDGTYMASYTSDPYGYFRHNPDISDWNSRYQVQYYTLFGLTDLNQENSTIDAYLKAAARRFLDHNVDGFRIDAPKHFSWNWQYSMVNDMFTHKPTWVFGEWFQNSTGDTLYKDSVKFANTSGMSLLDFPLNQSIRNVFGSGNSFTEIDGTLNTENADFKWKEDLVTFVDNHDMTRFLSLNNNQTRLHQALAFIMTQRGVPCIYYGTEQYLFNNTAGGGDPYNRPMMNAWSTSTTAYQLIKKLSDLRRANNAVPYGSHQQRWMNSDVYIYERKFFNDVVLVAINKSATTTYSISGLNTALPAGSYSDYLTALLGGFGITVGSGSGGNNPVTTFNLGPGKVAVWHANASASVPWVGSIGPTRAQAGVKVRVTGEGFGATQGSVWFGGTQATIVAGTWSNTGVTVTVPAVAAGATTVTVKNSANVASNAIDFTVHTAKLIPVVVTVRNATTSMGENVFLTGSTVELGNWSTAWMSALGPFMTPSYPDWFLSTSLPAGQTVQFKAIKINGYGPGAVWECGANHSYTVPASGTGFVDFYLQGWCP